MEILAAPRIVTFSAKERLLLPLLQKKKTLE
jgi:hypothetical protein